MFSPNSQRSRIDPQSFSPHIPDRSSEYHAQTPYLAQVANISSVATPRYVAQDAHRGASYSDQYGQGSRQSFDNREALSPPNYYHQSYDRHYAGSLELHLPYRHLYVERPALLPPLKRLDTISVISNEFAQAPYHGEPDSLLTARSARSADTNFWDASSPTPSRSHSPLPQSPELRQKKQRREKPKIVLAADQPPTTQGKPRERVYVACVQCRTRKIRCDGAKPLCHNCGRRGADSNECSYDPIPKRRGPDKTPGARQRVARNARGEPDDSRRRRRSDTSATDVTSTSASSTATGSTTECQPNQSALTTYNPASDFSAISNYATECECHGLVQCPDFQEVSVLPGFGKPVGAVR